MAILIHAHPAKPDLARLLRDHLAIDDHLGVEFIEALGAMSLRPPELRLSDFQMDLLAARARFKFDFSPLAGAFHRDVERNL